MQLTNSQLRHLRGLSHHISPVVIVAGKGLTDNVMAEVEQALEHHELIKVKLRADRSTRATWAEQISRATGAVTVQTIGQVACFYRPNPERRVVELPRP